MSNTSIGSGDAGDSNENPAPDSLPSKTMGAESGPDDRSSGAERQEQAGTGADVPESAEQLGGLPASGVAGKVTDYPDGPNVAPSPWELDAAQGKSSLPPKD